MAESLDFTLKLPSLKELSETRIARCLWESRGILFDEEDCEHWDFEKMDIYELPIPKSLQDDLKVRFDVVEDHFDEIVHSVDWLDFSEFDMYEIIKTGYLRNNKIRWNAYGNIDLPQIVDLLLKDEGMSVISRFELACRFCRHQDVFELRNELTPYELSAFEDDGSPQDDYWIRVMKNDGDMLNYQGLEENVFNSLVVSLFKFDYNQAAMEYLWKKMSDEAKGRSIENLVSLAKSKVYSLKFENWFHILSLMTVDERVKILTSVPARVVRSFLKRPYQHLFFPLLRLVEDNETFLDSLPTFLMNLPLKHCDEAMRRHLYNHFRPLFPQHIHGNPEIAKYFENLRSCGHRKHVLELMRDATEAQKFDTLKRACYYCWKVQEVIFLKDLIEVWLSRASWRQLKNEMKRMLKDGWLIINKSGRRGTFWGTIREFCDSIDDFFGM